MTLTFPTLRPIHLLLALAIAAFGAMLIAQIEGERGIAPIASGGDFEVRDVKIDIAGPNPDAARQAGWRLAQRLAWKTLWKRTNGAEGPTLGDSVLDGLVSGIEVQQEQIGPTRYIATLSVHFDRARAGQALGVSRQTMRSPPLLVIPVMTDGGVSTTFESNNEWQRAWAMFRIGDSAIDYVRTPGDGPDAALLTAGQINRRGRTWWRVLLDLYGTADVIMPLARIERSWPGGPVTGRFAARYGPDNELIGSFDLKAPSSDKIPEMMAEAVRRMDQLYTGALISGVLRPDPSLIIEQPLNAVVLDNAVDLDTLLKALPSEGAVATVSTISVTLQFDTPTADSVGAAQTVVRGVPGVRSAATTSLALGGTSVMQVGFDGSVDQLRAALEARGFAVTGAGTNLRIARRGPGGGSGQ